MSLASPPNKLCEPGWTDDDSDEGNSYIKETGLFRVKVVDDEAEEVPPEVAEAEGAAVEEEQVGSGYKSSSIPLSESESEADSDAEDADYDPFDEGAADSDDDGAMDYLDLTV